MGNRKNTGLAPHMIIRCSQRIPLIRIGCTVIPGIQAAGLIILPAALLRHANTIVVLARVLLMSALRAGPNDHRCKVHVRYNLLISVLQLLKQTAVPPKRICQDLVLD